MPNEPFFAIRSELPQVLTLSVDATVDHAIQVRLRAMALLSSYVQRVDALGVVVCRPYGRSDERALRGCEHMCEHSSL